MPQAENPLSLPSARPPRRIDVVDIDATTLIVAIGLIVAVALLWLTLVAA
jgi:hypothetical protein